MAHTPKSIVSAGEHILDVTVDPDTQADGLERLAELTQTASPEARARLEHTIVVIAQSRQIRSMTLKTIEQARKKQASIEQGSLLTEAHSMDEERRALVELNILNDHA